MNVSTDHAHRLAEQPPQPLQSLAVDLLLAGLIPPSRESAATSADEIFSQDEDSNLEPLLDEVEWLQFLRS